MAHAEDGARESSDAPLETAGIKYPSGFRRFVIVLGILFGVFVVRENQTHTFTYIPTEIYISKSLFPPLVRPGHRKLLLSASASIDPNSISQS
jgi:hypothetical protein